MKWLLFGVVGAIGLAAALLRASRMDDRRTARAIVVGLVLLALCLRVSAAGSWNACRPDSPERLIGDEPGYDNLARELLQGFGFTWPGRVPLYPAWLAGIYLLTDGSYQAVPYVQAVAGVVVVPLVYVLGRRLFNRSAGILAAFLTAVSYVLVHQPLHFLSEFLFTPAVLIVAATLERAMSGPTYRRFFWAGVMVGISSLVRPTLLFFPLTAIVPIWALMGRGRAIRCWMIYLAASVLVATPWALRNYAKYRAWFPLQTSNAILWQGSPEYYHLLHDEGYTYMRVWEEILYGPGWEEHDPNSIEGDRWWTRRAVRSIAAEPGVYLRYAAEKLVTYWVGDPNADWGDTYAFNYRALRHVGFTAPDAMLYMAARGLPIVTVVAIPLVWNRRRQLLPVYSLLAYTTVLHAVTHAEARLSDPFQPLLIVVIVGAVVSVLRDDGCVCST
jgi:4-amino-4-deoxy-L-arabinose transferase-like glycosyltransferase